MTVEQHPLEPFLPANAVLLMLGSFPPQQKRWSMDFFYPNLQNDMWRIFGQIFFGCKDHFLLPGGKAFDKGRIVRFLEEKGIALYDTASAVCRLQDNASDKFLEVVEPTDIGLLLRQLPCCRATLRAMASALRYTSGPVTAEPKSINTPPSRLVTVWAYIRKSRYDASPRAAPLVFGCSCSMSFPMPICTVQGTRSL